MVDCIKNLYEILDIPYDATFAEIKAAYKKLVRIYHPDVNKTQDAEIKFKLLNNAYDVLSDEIKRKNYDSLLNIAKNKREEEKKEIIRPIYKFHKEKPKEQNEEKISIDNNSIIKIVKITEKEAKKGTSRTVNILNTQKCPKCMGKKFINGAKCSFCLGEGEKKTLKKIEVEIKKDINENELIYVGKVNSSALYDKKLFLKILIEPPKKLYFEGDNIIVNIKIPVYDAILGTEKEINIEPYGLINCKIPPLIKPNTRIPLDINDKISKYFANIDVIFPDNITCEEKELYDKIKLVNSRN